MRLYIGQTLCTISFTKKDERIAISTIVSFCSFFFFVKASKSHQGGSNTLKGRHWDTYSLLVWVYRRNLGRKTAPDVRHVRSSPAVVAVERQESGDGGNVNHHKTMDNQKTKEVDVV